MMAISPRRLVLGELGKSDLTHRVVDSESNMVLVPDLYLTPSPEEQIIRQRSVHQLGTPVSLKMDNIEKKRRLSSPNRISHTRKRLILTPPCASSSPFKDQTGASRSKRCRFHKRSQSVPLSTHLKGYTTEQLANVIDNIVFRYPELEEEVRQDLSLPDIQPLEERLNYLHHNIFRAMPSTRWCSTRDAYAYHRVKGHIDAFKKVCTEQGKVLVDAECWEAVFRYSLTSWRYVHQLPAWDDPSHNDSKTSCFRHLAAQCLTALKKSSLETDYLKGLRQRLAVASQLSAEIQPCINYIDKILKSQSLTEEEMECHSGSS